MANRLMRKVRRAVRGRENSEEYQIGRASCRERV